MTLIGHASPQSALRLTNQTVVTFPYAHGHPLSRFRSIARSSSPARTNCVWRRWPVTMSSLPAGRRTTVRAALSTRTVRKSHLRGPDCREPARGADSGQLSAGGGLRGLPHARARRHTWEDRSHPVRPARCARSDASGLGASSTLVGAALPSSFWEMTSTSAELVASVQDGFSALAGTLGEGGQPASASKARAGNESPWRGYEY
jgi:hypothetical protein